MAARVVKLLSALCALCLALSSCAAFDIGKAKATPSATPRATRTPLPPVTPAPTPTPSPADLLAEGMLAQRNGEFDRAVPIYTALAAGQSPETTIARRYLGATYLQARRHSEAIDLLVGMQTEAASADDRAWVAFQLAAAYRAAQQWPEALEQQAACLGFSRILADRVQEWNGDCYLEMGRPADAADAYRLALAALPTGHDRAPLLEKAIGAHTQAKETDQALQACEELMQVASGPTARAHAQYVFAQACESMDRREDAISHYRAAISATYRAHESYLSLVRLVELGGSLDDMQRGLVDYYNGAYQAAVAPFERLIASGDGDIQEARYYLGLARLALDEYPEALTTFDALLSGAPTHPRAAEATLARGKALEGTGDLAAARKTYLGLADSDPEHAFAPTALWRSAELAERAHDWVGAARDYLWLQRRYPSDGQAARAMWRAGLAYYRAGRLSDAAYTWQEVLARYPGSPEAAAAGYWLGKAALALGDEAGARRRWSEVAALGSGWYAVRAVDSLQGVHDVEMDEANVLTPPDPEADRRVALAWMAAWSAVPTDTLDALPPSVLQDEGWPRGLELHRMGLDADAAAELRLVVTAIGKEPAALFALCEALRDMGLYRLSIECAERLAGMSPANSPLSAPAYVQRLAYPTYFEDLVFSEASRTGLDPLLLFALIRQESLFDSVAASWAGATGLTQVMPATGEWVALRLGWRGFQASDLTRPFISVKFGAWYLARQLSDLGSVILALAAYNAGAGQAHAWSDRFGMDDPDLFVESIPFDETHTYVTRVIEQYRAYGRVYRPSQTSPGPEQSR